MKLWPSTRWRWAWTTPAKVSAKVIVIMAVHMIQKLAMLSH